jgi:pimeloyl-ACP methyl ester carboxylesterase
MINYYRSSVRTPPKKAEAAIHPIQAPTLVIWGDADHYLGSDLAEPEHDDVPDLRLERLPDASHWVHHDEAERVTQLLIEFFSPRTAGHELTQAEQATLARIEVAR